MIDRGTVNPRMRGGSRIPAKASRRDRGALCRNRDTYARSPCIAINIAAPSHYVRLMRRVFLSWRLPAYN